MSTLPVVKLRPPEKMRIERDVKAEVKKIFAAYRVYLFAAHGQKIFELWPVSNGMGKHGVPDANVCFLGSWLSIETKYGDAKPTDRQRACLQEIRDSGGVALVINETNLNELTLVCEYIYGLYLRKIQSL